MREVNHQAALTFAAQEVVRLQQEEEELLAQMRFELEERIKVFTPALSAALMLTLSHKKWTLEVRVGAFMNTPWSAEMKNVARPYSYGHLAAFVKGVQTWAELEPFFEAMQLAGIDLGRWKSEDDAESYTRIYKVEGFFGKGTAIKIHAALPGDTDDCRRVIVGYSGGGFSTPTPSRPIYRFDCK